MKCSWHLANLTTDHVAFLVAQIVKNQTAVWKTQVQFLGQEDALVREMATRSSFLTWGMPWTEEPGRLQAMGPQRVRTRLKN